MTEKQAFRIGFLMQCAEEGLTPTEVQERIAKAAMLKQSAIPGLDALMKGLGYVKDVGIAAAQPFLGAGKTALIAGPPLLGAGAGYMASQFDET